MTTVGTKVVRNWACHPELQFEFGVVTHVEPVSEWDEMKHDLRVKWDGGEETGEMFQEILNVDEMNNVIFIMCDGTTQFKRFPTDAGIRRYIQQNTDPDGRQDILLAFRISYESKEFVQVYPRPVDTHRDKNQPAAKA